MSRKKRQTALSPILLLAAGVVWLFPQVPQGVWWALAGLAFAGTIYKLAARGRKSVPSAPPRADPGDLSSADQASDFARTMPMTAWSHETELRPLTSVQTVSEHLGTATEAPQTAAHVAVGPINQEPSYAKFLVDPNPPINESPEPPNPPQVTPPTSTSAASQSPSYAKFLVDADEPVRVATSAPSVPPTEYRIPRSPSPTGPGKWVPVNTPVEVAGVTIPGGMVYVGTTLNAPNGMEDPCLIDPSKQVANRGDHTAPRPTSYWPSYSKISAPERRAYLNWLAGGRCDPDTDIGYVFLFFYGLERRAIVDANENAGALADWPAIADELRRLLSIYGQNSGSFHRYATELLNWVSLGTQSKLYQQPVPSLPKTYELPAYLRLALGQASLDSAPIPADLALAWVKLDPNYCLRTAATRCEDQFDELFRMRYRAQFGPGMTVSKNRTKLKLVYQPASSGLLSTGEIKLTFGETPDISVLTKPIKTLRTLADAVTDELASYSRFVGRTPEERNALEGLLLLPFELWPSSSQLIVEDLKQAVTGGPVLIPYQDLLIKFGAKAALTKERAVQLATTFDTLTIGMEPDLLGGARLPKLQDNIVLFPTQSANEAPRGTPPYQAALLTLQLASAVAAADGAFDDHEFEHLRTQVSAWVHLTASHQVRLQAHLQLLRVTPVPLTSLKKRLEGLDTPSKESIASFMALMAQADGSVSAEEVKLLEKIYKILGLDAKQVFSDIHAANTAAAPSGSEGACSGTGTGFKLDPARIAALQQDTARVSALLASIFAEDGAEAADPLNQQPPEDGHADKMPPEFPEPLLLGLDESHAALARMLLTRPEWSRSELLDVAADLDLMLDGALEHINEAAFEAHDIPFTEGDDPIEVNAEVREKIEA